MHDTEDMPADVDFDEEEPSFSDPEDFEDDVDDEGEKMQERCRLFLRPGELVGFANLTVLVYVVSYKAIVAIHDMYTKCVEIIVKIFIIF